MKDSEMYLDKAEKAAITARDLYWNVDRHTPDLSAADKLVVLKNYIEALENTNHQLRCSMATHQVTHWPRIKDLPEAERVPFREWLSGQTCPMLSGLAYAEQDAYYQSDYAYWKDAWSRGKTARVLD